MIAHVGAGGGSGNRQGRPQRGPTASAGKSGGRPVAAVRSLVRVRPTVISDRFQDRQLIPAEARGENKGGGFPLLPGQLFSGHQIQGGTDDGIRAPVADPVRVGMRGRKGFEGQVVSGAEAGEGLRLASAVGGPQIAADEPIAIEMMQRELIDINPQ